MNVSNDHPRKIAIVVLSLVSIALTGCGLLGGTAPTATSTTAPTKTATTVPPTPTDTPEPTATYTATPDLVATEQMQATQTAEAQTAEIDEILQIYGYSINSGSLGWSQTVPDEIKASGGGRVVFNEVAEGQNFSNYILHTNVAWESEIGAAGCGIIFRSENSLGNGQQYRLYTLRLSGLPAWDVELWEFDNWQATVTGDIKYTSAIDQGNGAVNEYVLIVEGSTLTVYINETRVGTVTIATRSNGVIGFFTWQTSGETTCTFDDAWVWELED